MNFKLGFAIAAVITVAAAPIASAHDNGYNHRHQGSQSNGDQQLVGGAIGAVVGGVLGSQVAGSGARTEGSVLGAVIGGVAGAAIAGNGNNNSHRQYGGNGYLTPIQAIITGIIRDTPTVIRPIEAITIMAMPIAIRVATPQRLTANLTMRVIVTVIQRHIMAITDIIPARAQA